jgi:hypothetical protein
MAAFVIPSEPGLAPSARTLPARAGRNAAVAASCRSRGLLDTSLTFTEDRVLPLALAGLCLPSWAIPPDHLLYLLCLLLFVGVFFAATLCAAALKRKDCIDGCMLFNPSASGLTNMNCRRVLPSVPAYCSICCTVPLIVSSSLAFHNCRPLIVTALRRPRYCTFRPFSWALFSAKAI